MTLDEATNIVREVVSEVSGEATFDDSDRPIGDLGLASIDGIQVAICLEVRLGLKFDNKVNPLADDERRRARSVAETATWLAEYVNSHRGGRRD